jgi:3-oxoacyl-[acyl-carrier protein] reductase
VTAGAGGGATRVALVTGGTRGIGRGIAVDLARAGWAVAVSYRSAEAPARQTRAAIEAAGARALAVRADLGDPGQAAALVREVEGAWGRVDALVHAAGPFHRVPLLAETPARWREAFRQNLDPLLFLAQAVVPGMRRRRWGRILGLGLATADRLAAQPNVTAYYISKVGVLVLVRSLARELAPHGITVNAISPGILETGSTEAPEREPPGTRIPAGRAGRVEDVVAAARFLLSDEAAYVTGANLHVSGGWGL